MSVLKLCRSLVQLDMEGQAADISLRRPAEATWQQSKTGHRGGKSEYGLVFNDRSNLLEALPSSSLGLVRNPARPRTWCCTKGAILLKDLKTPRNVLVLDEDLSAVTAAPTVLLGRVAGIMVRGKVHGLLQGIGHALQEERAGGRLERPSGKNAGHNQGNLHQVLHCDPHHGASHVEVMESSSKDT